jgi:hypothetical protein
MLFHAKQMINSFHVNLRLSTSPSGLNTDVLVHIKVQPPAGVSTCQFVIERSLSGRQHSRGSRGQEADDAGHMSFPGFEACAGC